MKSAELYTLNQTKPFKSILLYLQLLIETNFPEIELQYKWKIPVYYLNDNQLCYINPSLKKGYVDAGLWVKSILEEYDAFLISEGRKVVQSLRYFSIDDIHEAVLVEICKHNYKGFWKKD